MRCRLVLFALTFCDSFSFPSQRVCKYPLILGELLKQTPRTHGDHAQLQEAIAKTIAVVESINKGQRQMETFNKLAELAADIRNDAPDLNILSSNRTFLREGTFKVLDANGDVKSSSTSLVLFDDIVILGHYSSKKRNSSANASLDNMGKGRPQGIVACCVAYMGSGFVYESHWQLTDVRCTPLPAVLDPQTQAIGFQLHFGREVVHRLLCPSRDSRFLWFSELTKVRAAAHLVSRAHTSAVHCRGSRGPCPHCSRAQGGSWPVVGHCVGPRPPHPQENLLRRPLGAQLALQSGA